MDLASWFKNAVNQLNQVGIGTARLDALILLEDVLGMDRARILAEPERQLSPAEADKLKNLLNHRTRHVPMAYVRGVTEFYTRNFVITPAVLEPRPESETMIDELKKLADLPRRPLIADIGTGSGALGISAKLELPGSHVELIEIDPVAAKVAQTNVDVLTPDIKIVLGDLLIHNDEPYDVLLCNLPYVPDEYQINRAALHEPKLAIYGGADGLDVYRKLFKQITQRVNKPLYILTESLPFQHASLVSIGTLSGYEVASINDFIIVFRRVQK